jgi:hypothetical protein
MIDRQLRAEANAQQVRTVNVQESLVVEELQGWYFRRLNDFAAQSRKQLANAQYNANSLNPDLRLPAKLQAGEIQNQLSNWEALADAAKKGVFLFSNTSMRSPEYVSDPKIRGLRERAESIGLVEFESESTPLGDRY